MDGTAASSLSTSLPSFAPVQARKSVAIPEWTGGGDGAVK